MKDEFKICLCPMCEKEGCDYKKVLNILERIKELTKEEASNIR